LYNAQNGSNIMIGYFDSSNNFVEKNFVSEYVITNTQDSNCQTPTSGLLSIPHSATFIDLDGDCMPDIFLTKTFTDSSDSTTKT